MRVNLTHGFSSNVIEKKGIGFHLDERLNFDAKTPIRFVQGYPKSNVAWIRSVKFMDNALNTIAICDPYNRFEVEPDAAAAAY